MSRFLLEREAWRGVHTCLFERGRQKPEIQRTITYIQLLEKNKEKSKPYCTHTTEIISF